MQCWFALPVASGTHVRPAIWEVVFLLLHGKDDPVFSVVLGGIKDGIDGVLALAAAGLGCGSLRVWRIWSRALLVRTPSRLGDPRASGGLGGGFLRFAARMIPTTLWFSVTPTMVSMVCSCRRPCGLFGCAALRTWRPGSVIVWSLVERVLFCSSL